MRTEFRHDIQGLRAVAVAGVVLAHAGVGALEGGYAGVDVFFVISGFLITLQLLAARERDGRIRFAAFYGRRARRLLPAALVVIVLTAIASWWCLAPTSLPQSLTDAAAAALYVPNLVLAARGTDYLADATPSLYQHYWSLGVEEQFYLVWPVLIALVAAVFARRRAALAVLFAVVAAASFAWCLFETGRNQPWAFFPVWSRAWQFAVGALCALALPLLGRVPAGIRAAASWVGLAGILIAYLAYDDATVYPGSAAVLPTLAAALLVASGDPSGGAGLVLRLRPAQWLGLVSYSLYLVHWPLLQLAQARVGHDESLPLWSTLALAGLAVPVAWALHRFVEGPLRRTPRRAAPAGRGVVALLTAGVVVAGMGLAGSAVVAGIPIASARAATDGALTSPPSSTGYVPAGMHPSLRAAPDDNPSMYAEGCQLGFLVSEPRPCSYGDIGGPRVVLFGDSHAAQWQPALAEIAAREGFELVAQTKSSCRSTLEAQPGDAERDRACTRWREAVLDQLAAEPPELVILANFAGAHTAPGSDPGEQWRSGLARTVQAIPDSSRVVVLADSPDLGESPIPCLVRHVDDADACAVSAERAMESVGRAAVESAVATTRAGYVDITGYLCADRCPPVIGNTLVYRDANHLTATFVTQLADPLRDALAPYLP
ncbi:acyltransferase [Microbacterium nanhaiense]|uniref:Acyltransferase n=1 Tax=Microbacterium nanhaiense TaxID=1301026 RepID=A0ABQ2N586_9MICO|nr:acyltransferase family protein [Microbacterium nanhaiense]GGO66377.1 acyltransferase [Microbacterium nanhaiense]